MSEQSRRDLAQLLLPVIRWTPDRGFSETRALIDHALSIGVGGFLLSGGEQDGVRALAKELQLKSKYPLLLAAELERGAGQQFAGATGLPPVAAITAMGDIEALRRAARLTAREARTMGVNWILAPVCDLDLLAENPLVGARALGNDARKVAPLVQAWVEATQAEGVMACAKHFPGIGRATQDFHRDAVSVDTPADQLKELDLHPFRAAISCGVASVMMAHVAYPALDSSKLPATLSREIVQWLLRQQLKFENLVVGDLATLAGVHDGRDVAEACVQALRAGCDVLLSPGDLDTTLGALEKALDDGTLEPERVKQSVRRRLKWAQWVSPPNDWRRPSGADTAWGALLADKVLRIEHGPVPVMAGITEVAIVDDDDEVRQGLQVHDLVFEDRLAGIAVKAGLDRAGNDFAAGFRLADAHIEAVNIANAEFGHFLVALFHFAHGPFEGDDGLFGVGDDGGEQMRDAVIDGEFEHFRIDHDQAALLGGEAVEQ